MKIKELIESKSATVLDKLTKLLKDSTPKEAVNDKGYEKGIAISPKIAGYVNQPGTVSAEDELTWGPEDIGNPEAKPSWDNYASWQDELKSAQWLVPMHKPAGAWYHQGLIKHDTKPFMYFVTTDGESGTWIVNKIVMK